jgi:hypothetical protein
MRAAFWSEYQRLAGEQSTRWRLPGTPSGAPAPAISSAARNRQQHRRRNRDDVALTRL